MRIGKKLNAIVIALTIAINCFSQLYTSEIYPNFSLLYQGGYCVSNEDGSYLNDTTISLSLLTEGRYGYIYYSYSSTLGGISNVSYTQYINGEVISYDNFIFPDITDTIVVAFTITANNVESFCPFFLAFNPLSVTWGTIDCYQFGNYLKADVQTLTETNSHTLHLEVSNDLSIWNEIDVLPMGINSSQPLYYVFNVPIDDVKKYIYQNTQDKYAFSTQIMTIPLIVYIRLVQVDVNGESQYSDVFPVQLSIPVDFQLPSYKNYDVSGRKIK